MLNIQPRCQTRLLAALVLGWGAGAQGATLEMRVDGGFVTGTLTGAPNQQPLSFNTRGSFADGGGALFRLFIDEGAGPVSGALEIDAGAVAGAKAAGSWDRFTISGVLGGGANGLITLNVASAKGPYITSQLFANGALLQSFDVPGALVSASNVPEPTTWAMMLAGLAGACLRLRRDRRGLSDLSDLSDRP